MKSDLMGVGTPINKKDQKDLLNETKETLATDVKIVNNQRSFGLLDLWNLQKIQRTSASMRRRQD